MAGSRSYMRSYMREWRRRGGAAMSEALGRGARALYAARKKAGVCVQCGKRKARKDAVRCGKCLAAQSAAQVKHKAALERQLAKETKQ